MASSVASAREMERWAKERKEAVQHSVPVSLTAKQNFKSFQPDLEQLAKFEDKVQQLAERQEAKESELEVVPIINVMGSTAGAGSGEFHTYRGYRAKEMARLEGFEREKKLEVALLNRKRSGRIHVARRYSFLFDTACGSLMYPTRACATLRICV